VNEICGLEDVGFDPLVRTLLGVAQRLESRVESALAASGLSFTKLGILHHLIQSGELPLSSLAERISCVKSNITQLMDRLETEGLVARTTAPNDRRSIRANITAEGRRRYAEAAKILEEEERALLKCLPQTERRKLGALLNQLCH